MTTKDTLLSILFDAAADYVRTLTDSEIIKLFYELSEYPVKYEVINYNNILRSSFTDEITERLICKLAYGWYEYKYPYIDIAQIVLPKLYHKYAQHEDLIGLAIANVTRDIDIDDAYKIAALCYIKKLPLNKYIKLIAKPINLDVIPEYIKTRKDINVADAIVEDLKKHSRTSEIYRKLFIRFAGLNVEHNIKTNMIYQLCSTPKRWIGYLVLARQNYEVLHPGKNPALKDYVFYGLPSFFNHYEASSVKAADSADVIKKNEVFDYLKKIKTQTVKVVDTEKERSYQKTIKDLEIKISNLQSANEQLRNATADTTNYKMKISQLKDKLSSSENYKALYEEELKKSQDAEKEAQELRAQIYAMQEQLDNIHTHPECTLIEKENCVDMFKVLVVGGHQKLHSKLRKRFQNWRFIEPDSFSTIDARIVKEYDAMLFICNYASHALTSHFEKYGKPENIIKTYRNNYSTIVDDVFSHFNDNM